MTTNSTSTPDAKRHLHVKVWVGLGAMASVAFSVMLLATLLGSFFFGIITSLSVIQWIAFWVWPFLCLLEIFLQVIPMIVRQQVGGWHVIADFITSWFPMIGCVLVLAGALFGAYGMNAYGWLIWSESCLTAVIELVLLFLSYRLIAAARDEQR